MLDFLQINTYKLLNNISKNLWDFQFPWEELFHFLRDFNYPCVIHGLIFTVFLFGILSISGNEELKATLKTEKKLEKDFFGSFSWVTSSHVKSWIQSKISQPNMCRVANLVLICSWGGQWLIEVGEGKGPSIIEIFLSSWVPNGN